MKTLHVLRRRNDRLAEAAICSEFTSGGEGYSASVLLIQDAVLGSPAVPVPVYVNAQDLQARGVTRPYEIIDYDEICKMILEHDRTVVW